MQRSAQLREGTKAGSHVDDAAAVEEVQALRHRERHGPPLLAPVEAVAALPPVPEQRTAEVAALHARGSRVLGF